MWNVNCCWAEPSWTLTGLTRLLHNLESGRALASLHTADTFPLPGNRKPWTPLMMCLGAAGWPPLRAERPTCPITHEQFIQHRLIGVWGGKHIRKCGVETVERSSEVLEMMFSCSPSIFFTSWNWQWLWHQTQQVFMLIPKRLKTSWLIILLCPTSSFAAVVITTPTRGHSRLFFRLIVVK